MDIDSNEKTPETQPQQAQPTPLSTAESVRPVEKKNKKQLLWVIPLVMLLAAGLIAAGYYLGQQQSNDTQGSVSTGEEDTTDKNKAASPVAPTASVDPYADWSDSSRINPADPSTGYIPAFTFKYPSTWNRVSPLEGVACGIIISPTATTWTANDSTICLGTDMKYSTSLKVATQELLQDHTIASSANISVAGKSAIQAESAPQTIDGKTTVKLITLVDDVDIKREYFDTRLDKITQIGIMHITGEYIGDSEGLAAFKEQYKLIIESIVLK